MNRRIAVLAALLFAACGGSQPVPPGPDASPGPGLPDGCTRACSGKSCGDDGCGGNCGTCSAGSTCDQSSGTCQCQASCGTKTCGDDGCGHKYGCGECAAGQACTQGSCQACTPVCNGKVCGDDSNGCSCGLCPAGTTCDSSGQCEAPPRLDAGAPGLDASTIVPSDAGPQTKPDASVGGLDAGSVTPGSWADYLNWANGAISTLCDWYLTCNLMDQAQMNACTTYVSAVLLDPGRKQSIESGTQLFDASVANACLALIQAANCNPSALDTSNCSTLWAPNSGQGQLCYSSSDCKDQLNCTGQTCAQTCESYTGSQQPGQTCDYFLHACDSSKGSCAVGTSGTGVCVAFIAVGQTCYGTGVPIGAQCDPATSTCDYTSTKCVALLAAGSPCPYLYSGVCQKGLYCQQTSTGDAGFVGACAPYVAQGGACTTNGDCVSDLECDSVRKTCQPNEVNRGDACSLDQYCQGGSWCMGADASSLGVCTAQTMLSAGQTCSTSSNASSACGAGLFCDSTSSKCKTLLSDGQAPCDDNSCKMFLSCVVPAADGGVAAGTCRAEAMPGGSCAQTACLDGYVCDSTTNTCSNNEPNGTECYVDWMCANNYCANFACADVCIQ